MLIPFPNFEPDKSPFNKTASNYIMNALPSADGWKGMPDFVPVSDALTSAPRGTFFTRDLSGTPHVFVFQETTIEKLDTTSTPYGWTDVKRTSGGNYSLASGDSWSVGKFGNRIIAVHANDVPQYYDLGTSTDFENLPGSPPQGAYVETVGDFVFIGNLSSGKNKVHWSELNNSESWVLDGVSLSDEQLIPEGETVQGIKAVPGGAIVFMKTSIQRFTFNPSNTNIFTRDIVNPARGVIAPFSIAQYDPVNFAYLSSDGFFMGVEGRPIGGERVDEWFFNQVTPDAISEVTASVDPYEKCIWWRYEKNDGNFAFLGYDWQLDRWFQSDANYTHGFAMESLGIPWGGLSNLYSSIGEVNVPFNSRLFKGGQPLFAAFNSDNKLAFATGGNMQATFDTAEVKFFEDKRAFVRGARLVGSGNMAVASVTPSKSDYHGDDFVDDTVSSASSRSGVYPMRCDGQLHKFRTTLAAGQTWSVMTGLEVDAVPSGRI